MKKSIAYGIILFFVGSFMMGCGKSSKSASNPTPTNTTTNNVSNFFGNNGSTLNNISGKIFTVTNSSVFQSMLNYNGLGTTGSGNFFNTGNGIIDQFGNCLTGFAATWFLNWTLDQLNLNSNNSNVNIGGSCTVGNNGVNGITGTQGLAGSYPTTINNAVSGQYIRGSITVNSQIVSFDARSNGSNSYYDSAKRIGIQTSGSNQLVFYFVGSNNQAVQMGYVTL